MAPKLERIALDDKHLNDIFEAVITSELERYGDPKDSFLCTAIAEQKAQARQYATSMTKKSGHEVGPSISAKWFSWIETQVTARQDAIDAELEEMRT